MAAPLDGVLDVHYEAGIDRIREKSVALTEYLIRLVDDLPDPLGGISSRPRPSWGARRGRTRGGVSTHSDTRAPRGRRLPSAERRSSGSSPHTGFEDVFDVAETLREIYETCAYEEYDPSTVA